MTDVEKPDAQKLIAEVLDRHWPTDSCRLNVYDKVLRHECRCREWHPDIREHLAAEIDRALGGLTLGTSGRWVARRWPR